MIKLNRLGTVGNAPTILYEVAGYTTSVPKLAVIFNMHVATLRNRINAGWDIAPALLIPTDSQLNVHAARQVAQGRDFDEQLIKRLKEYFTANPSVFK